jgi:hypothetical protein
MDAEAPDSAHRRWLDGDLRAWRRDADGWLGYVCYAESAGIRYLEWVGSEQVKLAR